MIEKLHSKDIRFIGICVGVCLISLFVISFLIKVAWSEPIVKFEITRGESKERAIHFLKDRGWDVHGYKHVSRYSVLRSVERYLRRELDSEEAAKVFANGNGLQWRHRWYIPSQKEEYRVYYTLSGDLAGFSRVMSQDEPGDTLSQDIALQIAGFFLGSNFDWNPDDWTLRSANTSVEANRWDHTFEWDGLSSITDDAVYRISVIISGSEVRSYYKKIHLSDTVIKDDSTSFPIVTGLLGISILFGYILVIILAKPRQIQWRFAFIVGGTVSLLLILSELNIMSNRLFYISTTDYTSEVIKYVLRYLVFQPLGSGLTATFAVAAMESLYRDQFPDHFALRNILSVNGMKTVEFSRNVIAGLTFVLASSALSAIATAITMHFGDYRAPLDTGIYNLNVALPLMTLFLRGAMGLTQSVSLIFIICGIKKISGSTFLGITASVLIFGIISYFAPDLPKYYFFQEMVYFVIIGVVFVRIGIIATFMISIGSVLLRDSIDLLVNSTSPYYITTGIVAIGLFFIVPIIYIVFSYFRTGGFVKADGLKNIVDTDTLKSGIGN